MTIAAFWDEFTNNPPTGSGDDIRINTFGTAPNRQFWIKWYSFEIGNPYLSYAYFACVLEESTNNIYVVDLYSTTSTSMTATVGLQLNSSTAIQYGDNLIADAGNGSSNSDNDYYEFYMPQPDDVGISNVLADYTGLLTTGSPVNLSAVVKNYGMNAASNFPISWQAGDGNSSMETYSGTLAPGAVDTFAFSAPWYPAMGGDVEVTAIVSLSGDTNPFNDSASTTIYVIGTETLNYEQDFENYSGNPSSIGWLGEDNTDFGTFTPSTTSDGTWASDGFGNVGSSGSARFNFFSTSSTDMDWLITPPLDMTSMGPNNQLIFDIALTPYTGSDTDSMDVNDTLFVVASTDGMTWDRSHIVGMFTKDDNIPNTGMSASIDLSAYDAETSLYIGFLAWDLPVTGANDYNIYIDNLFIGVPPAIPIFGLTPDSADFGVVYVNNTSAYETFTISNDGGGTLTINGTSIIGSDASDFVLSDNNSYPVNLGFGEKIYVDVAFSPNSAGVKTANLQVSDNTAEGLQYAFLRGEGFDPTVNSFPYVQDFENSGNIPDFWTNDPNDSGKDWEFDTSAGHGPDGDHTTGTGYFAYVDDSSPDPTDPTNLLSPPFDLTGLTDPQLRFWYYSYMDGGTADQGWLHVDVYDGSVWHMDVIDSIGSQAEEWREKIVNLTPYQSSSTQIRFRVNETSSFYHDISIDDVVVQAAPTTPVFYVSPDSVDFGTVPVGGISAYTTITITNIGGGTMDVSSVSLTGADAGDFVLADTNSYPVMLAGGEELKVDVALSPNSGGAKTANLSVVANSTTYDVPLTGNAMDYTVTTYPYIQDFDAFPSGITTGLIAEGWSNPVGEDDGDWTVDADGTPSLDTGPSGDHTSGTGNYLFTESSVGANPGSPNMSAYAVSPPFDLSSLTYPYLKFWYHMYGSTMGDLHVDVFSNGTWENDVLNPYLSGNHGDMWFEAAVSLIPYAGQTIQIRFRGITGSSYYSDMAIDDIWVGEATGTPGLPTNPNPADGAEDAPIFTTLSWINGFFTTAVDLYFGTDSALVANNDPSVQVLSDTLASSYSPSSLMYTETYYWKVVAKNPNGNTEGPIWAFTISLPTPLNLTAVSGDGFVELDWQPPLPLGEVKYDDGTAEAWYWVGGPSTTDQYYYVKFNAPTNGFITDFAILNASDTPIAWEQLLITSGDGSGNPDLANPWQSFSNVPVTSTIAEGGEWEVLNLSTPHAVTAGEVYYVAAQFPAGSDVGPFIARDTDSNAGRTYFTSDAGATWTQAGGNNIIRSYISTTAAKEYTLSVEPAKQGSFTNIPLLSDSKEKAVQASTKLAQSYKVPALTVEDNRVLQSYNVYRSTTPGSYGAPLASTTNTFYTDNSVTNGTEYFYVVSAVYTEGESGYSNEVMAYPQAAAAVPYTNSFDVNDGGWYVLSGEWEWGAPDPNYPDGPAAANSPPNVWGTNLDGDYSNPSNSWLIQPFDLSSARGGTGCLVSFYIWYDLEEGFDYGYVAVDGDNDGVYNVLATYNGTSSGWEYKQVIIPGDQCTSYAKLAFIMISDGSVSYAGMYIDDVEVGSLPTYNQDFITSWNLIGLPVSVDNPDYQVLYPNSIQNTLFEFDGTYMMVDSLQEGEGYWLRFPSAGTEPVAGVPFDSVTAVLDSGWNIIAGPSCNVPVSAINDPDGVIIPNTVFGYNGAYTLADTITQGDGFWIRASDSGQISIACGAQANARFAKLINDLPDLSDASNLTVNDASGASQTLYFNVELENADQRIYYSLPPLPPAGGFDARFSGDFRLSESSEAIIQIQSNQYPVTISADNLPLEEGYHYVIKEIENGEEKTSHPLQDGEDIEITNPQSRVLKLTRERLIPLTFEVLQNYPNPFNPKTIIKYAIPTDEKVELSIFNSLGQKISTLVNNNQQAGYYTVTWDATNQHGIKVGSGIYFYVVKAGKHKSIKKMILLK
ncbi:MAG: choice-of-anchor D domain-containing protein [Calditrichia bacterium]